MGILTYHFVHVNLPGRFPIIKSICIQGDIQFITDSGTFQDHPGRCQFYYLSLDIFYHVSYVFMIRTYYNAKLDKSVYPNYLFWYYCFQNPGNKIVSTVKISKRPTIIRKDKNHFDTTGTSA